VLRRAVSKKKIRYRENGFDLDLAYITDSIISMGFPSEKLEGIFRNPMSEVQRFLETFHPNHYKVYNLCAERSYDPVKFKGLVEIFPFEDHNPPTLDAMIPFCKSVNEWLNKDEQHIVAVHCKAGKGRTGCMISAYLLYSRVFRQAEDALRFFAKHRTTNNKGVTIPSQVRYVYYMQQIVAKGEPRPSALFLNLIRLHTLPRPHDGSYFFVIWCQRKKIHTTPLDTQGKVGFTCPDIPLCGDVKVMMAVKKQGKKVKMAQFSFHTSFVESDRIIIRKFEIDKACKDKKQKHFKNEFYIELQFSNTNNYTVDSGNYYYHPNILPPNLIFDKEYLPPNSTVLPPASTISRNSVDSKLGVSPNSPTSIPPVVTTQPATAAIEIPGASGKPPLNRDGSGKSLLSTSQTRLLSPAARKDSANTSPKADTPHDSTDGNEEMEGAIFSDQEFPYNTDDEDDDEDDDDDLDGEK